jgi:hypothetical protein
MRKPNLALLATLALVAIPGTASAAEGDPSASCTPLKVIYAERGWQDATPLDGRTACRPTVASKGRNTIEHFRLWRRYRLAAPYAGLNEGDKWLRYLAVPSYIVRCETEGYYGSGRWTAYNPSSGARNLYQFIGWGDPWPVNSPDDKVRAHEIASGLSLSNWACA